MLVLSAIFFAISFFENSVLTEIYSLVSFILGAFLLIYSFEQRVKLYPFVEGMAEPVETTITLLKQRGWRGVAVFVPKAGGVVMNPESTLREGDSIELRPYGHGLYEFYKAEIGDLREKGFDFARAWLPRALVGGSGLAESVSIRRDQVLITTKLVRPFVRTLCVKPFYTEYVCGTIGCPLVNSVGEALAASLSEDVSHIKCVYDPATQTATATHRVIKQAQA